MSESADARWLRRGRGITSAEVQGEAVLLDVRRGKYYSLNRTGAAVWELLTEPRTVPQLHQALLDRFDVEPEALSSDLSGLVEDLRRHGLIEEGEPDGSPAA